MLLHDQFLLHCQFTDVSAPIPVERDTRRSGSYPAMVGVPSATVQRLYDSCCALTGCLGTGLYVALR